MKRDKTSRDGTRVSQTDVVVVSRAAPDRESGYPRVGKFLAGLFVTMLIVIVLPFVPLILSNLLGIAGAWAGMALVAGSAIGLFRRIPFFLLNAWWKAALSCLMLLFGSLVALSAADGQESAEAKKNAPNSSLQHVSENNVTDAAPRPASEAEPKKRAVETALVVREGANTGGRSGATEEMQAATAKQTATPAAYHVAKEKNSSFGNIRSRITLEIEIPDAETDEDRLLAMMNAAVDRHRRDWPDVVKVRLWHPSYQDADTARSYLVYAPDGCGWTGKDCTEKLWSDFHRGQAVQKGNRLLYYRLSRQDIPSHLADYGRPTEDEKDAGSDAACRQKIRCWADRHSVDATVACMPIIESFARYDYEWTDGFLESKFHRANWKDQSAGSITYVGDKIKFQNGFGAWQHIFYFCHFDPQTGLVQAEVFER